jgi:hypothetical protein
MAPSEVSRPPRLTASTARLQQVQRVHAAIQQADSAKAGQLFSNFTHYSPADPDTHIAYKMTRMP